MEAVLHLLLLLLLTGQGFSQCFSSTNCTGGLVVAADQRACCVGTDDGLSFNNGTSCNLCIVHGFLRTDYDVEEDERLDTRFQLNVKGTTRFGGLAVPGLITAAADGTASTSDFERLTPITVLNDAEIRLFAANDEITLEYDDRVLLRFTPDNPDLIPGLEANGEYIRDTATVNIIDNDLLEISFLEPDYSYDEGLTMLSTPIRLQFRPNQNPFNITLSPVTVDTAESMGLGIFINSDTIAQGSRATAVTDFSDQPITVEVPANGDQRFTLSEFFTVVDDNIDEDEQSFAIVAEIGPDVPEKIKCFQFGVGEAGCRGRRGATEIRIYDNDPMIIGFTERIRTVSEGEVPGVDSFLLQINVASLRPSEREYQMGFRLQESSTNATIETLFPSSPVFDAIFGLRQSPDDPIEESRDLAPGLLTLGPPLITTITNDLIPEDLECFTLRIIPIDVPGRRELFTCNEDGVGADNYFCEHTICIEDDDEPFVVAFVETVYTVDESVGSVSVCVNLTQPEFDILDETVNVFVIDDPSSVYIPAGAPLATPDPPDFLSRYHMIEGSDYAQQTLFVNAIDDSLISEEQRIVCYNQTIYDDQRLELDEYTGLTLGARVRSATIITVVGPMRADASILILDNDRALIGLENTSYTVLEDAGAVEICAVISFPEITCPVGYHFEVVILTISGTAVDTTDYTAVNASFSFEACQTKSCVNVTITDDNVNEVVEFFIFSLARTADLNARIDLDPENGRIYIVDDEHQMTGLMCSSSGNSEVTIECSGMETQVPLQCSFDGGPFHQCTVPMILTGSVSPPGNHSVRIVASTGGESTVPYYITDEAMSVVIAKVPPLEVILTSGSPRVTESSIEVEFDTTRPVTSVTCFLRYDNKRDYQDCTAGSVTFSDLKSGRYVLKVYARNKQTDFATTKMVVMV